MKSASVPMSSRPSTPPTIPPTSDASLPPRVEKSVVLAPLAAAIGGDIGDEMVGEEADDGGKAVPKDREDEVP